MKERSLRAAAREIIANLDEKYDLVYVSQGDRLTPEQVALVVAGNVDDLWEDLYEYESHSRGDSIDRILEEATKDLFDSWEREDGVDYSALRDMFDRSPEQDEVREAVEERDTGEWLHELINGTPDVLLRITAIDEDDAFSFQGVTPQEVLAKVGLEASESNVKHMQYALDNASPEFSVLMGYWIVGADVRDVYALGGDITKVRITNPHLYLGNPFTGSGFITEEALEGVVTVDRSALRTDKAAFGYSVAEIYGGLSASQFEAKIEAVTNEEIS